MYSYGLCPKKKLFIHFIWCQRGVWNSFPIGSDRHHAPHADDSKELQSHSQSGGLYLLESYSFYTVALRLKCIKQIQKGVYAFNVRIVCDAFF